MTTELSFSALMDSAPDQIPEEKPAPDGRYKFLLQNAKYTAADGAFRFTAVLKPVSNLLDPSDDVAGYIPSTVTWSDKSPPFALQEFANFIKSSKLPVALKDGYQELIGRTYIGKIETYNEKQNVRNLRAED